MIIHADSVTPKIRYRFRLRFRLRTFLVVVTIFCVWLGWHIHGTRRQREAVAAIREQGGTVTYSYQMHAANTWSTPDRGRQVS